jgi:hypothetical protein
MTWVARLSTLSPEGIVLGFAPHPAPLSANQAPCAGYLPIFCPVPLASSPLVRRGRESLESRPGRINLLFFIQSYGLVAVLFLRFSNRLLLFLPYHGRDNSVCTFSPPTF